MLRRNQWAALGGAAVVVLTALPAAAEPFAVLAVGGSDERTLALVLGLLMAGLAVLMVSEPWGPTSVVLISGAVLAMVLYALVSTSPSPVGVDPRLLIRLSGAVAGLVGGLMHIGGSTASYGGD